MTLAAPADFRRRTASKLALVLLAAALTSLALTAGPASAKEFHSFSSSFGEAGSGNGQLALTEHSGLAVNQETGDVYVADTGNGRVEQFSAAGAFIRTFGTFFAPTFIAVDNSAGPSKEDVYVVDSAATTVSKFTAAGALVTGWGNGGHLDGSTAPGGAFGALQGIAVNPSGDLFVLSGETRISTFAPDGTSLEEFNLQYAARARGLALDNSAGPSGGDIYTIYANGAAETLRFGPSGSLLGEPDLRGGTALAVDPSIGDLYVDHGTEIITYSPTGERLETFGSPEPLAGGLSSAAGLATGAAGSVYVANVGASRIALFALEPGVTLATTLTGAGAGQVTSDPAGIACGATCAAEFAKGPTVTLTATPADERTAFTGWTVAGQPGACPGTGTCQVTMSTAKEVKAEFTPIAQHTLTVAKLGAGTGTVTGTSPGPQFTPIDCGATCQAEYNEGATIALTAAPTERSNFTGWTVAGQPGACPGTGTCQVTMSTAKEVKAEFTAIAQGTLTVLDYGTGTGTVSGTSTGFEFAAIDCGVICSAEYNQGSTLTLTATPAPHNRFVAWGADECDTESGPGEDECTLTVSANREVKATFINTYTLTVASAGPGKVSGTSGAIADCSATSGICADEYDEASTVVLTASPFAHHRVVWTGCDQVPSPTTCVVGIGTTAAEVKAAFPPNTHVLTLIPSGAGSVSANSGAISGCSSLGGNCAGAYIEAATLTLTAAPAPHQAVAWSGCTNFHGNTCEVEVGASELSVAASFAPITYHLTLGTSGSGQGSVTCDGGPCASSYPQGTVLAVAASAAPGSIFVGWSGAGCSGIGACEVTIQAEASLTATFNAIAPPAEEKCVVPKLIGRTLRRARSTLSAAHCTLGALTKPKRRQLGPLVVRTSTPAAGTDLPSGGQVDLRLAPKGKPKRGKR